MHTLGDDADPNLIRELKLAKSQQPREIEDSEVLWQRIRTGKASDDDKMDAASAAAGDNDLSRIPGLLELLEDSSENVRYFVLEALVIDLNQTGEAMAERCWRLLTEDPDESVRSMAGSCLGKIYFNTRSRSIFRRFVRELKREKQSDFAKGSIYGVLFKIAGRPPAEWPGTTASREELLKPTIDWLKVAELEDSLDAD